MTAAERATDAALAGAADHRAEQSVWLGTRNGLEFKADPRFGWDTPGDGCGQPAPGEGLGCTRLLGHAGRHIATGMDEVLAAWPGTHEPTLADLDDPAPDDAGQPPALVLPDGWERVNYSRGSRVGELSYCLRQASGLCEEDFYANPEPNGMVEMSGLAFELDEAKEVHARLGEAIRITEQLRAGAR